ncbi:MAG: UDP-N-acetylmuramate dehydrogenase [Alphaproteobacteria bacterium]
MAVASARLGLIDRLPPVRGRYSEAVPLARLTWFRVGGPAEVLYQPADRDDLALFLAGRPAEVPLAVVGVGSNLLVRDGGVPGVVIRLGAAFATIRVDGTRVHAGAAALDASVAVAAREACVAGLEFLSGVPGTIGGALRMNAGAYGRELKDVLVEAEAFDSGGRPHQVGVRELGYSYRHSKAPEDWIFVAALIEGQAGEKGEIGRRMHDIAGARKATQPIRSRTGGSTFMNPSGLSGPGPKAWQLIEQAGCRGLRRGGAVVSEQHCNFLINEGSATAADLEQLGEEVRRRVRETSGVELEWEIRRIGVPAAGVRP